MKILTYAITAFLLGTATMLVPFMLFEPTYVQLLGSGEGERIFIDYPQNDYPQNECREENTLNKTDSLHKALSPSTISAASILLVPSFFIALCSFIYLKKRSDANAGKVFFN